jgi:hypothetical protein
MDGIKFISYYSHVPKMHKDDVYTYFLVYLSVEF